MRLGSRPARRGLAAPAELADLRAIPWVFAWAQTRVNLPGPVRPRQRAVSGD